MSSSIRMGIARLPLPPLLLRLLLLLQLTMLMGGIGALPTIQQQGQHSGANYVQQLDKSFFQPPEVEQTIDEVQKILANDPALPRLTRGEIEELYEKVTREEYEKSIEAGDMSRADSMRALMLVLPYNTDNNTEENLQELYTRPPVTRVIDAYTPPNPIKFLTPDPSAMPRSTVPGGNPAVAATTYKPAYANLKKQLLPAPTATTYHPPAPAPVMYQLAPSLAKPSMDFQPVTNVPQAYDYPKSQLTQAALRPAQQTAQRFSSHYSAKNTQFLRKPKPALAASSSTVKPVADILESLGIVGGVGGGNGQTTHKRYAIDDYYPAESAPQPVVAVADLRGLQGARIRPDAYSNFKPLNIGEELRVKPEVEGYLTRFGIVKKSPKALKKAQPTAEPTGAHTELSTATARLPPQSNAELAKLLENLQELERLQTKSARTTPSTTSTSSTTSTTSTTTTTTTAAPPTSLPTAQLITHGAPLLIEPKKPRRRIDPNIDINFANAGNHQKPASSTDELSKLLQNLQELEKLKINPENVLKATNPNTHALSNRFSVSDTSTTAPPTTSTTTTSTAKPANSDARELQLILRQLQQLEQANAVRKATSKPTTTSTTARPRPPIGLGFGLDSAQTSGLGAADLLQLQRLLSDDSELERLYEQARNSKKAAKSRTTASATSTTSTTTSTTTTTTTPRPTKAAAAVDHAQFEALITRVQQLEQLQQPKPTTPGFSTRNVAALSLGPSLGLPSNDYAQLQQLAGSPLILSQDFGHVEISTAASTSKQRRRPLNSFERSNGLLQDVQPQDYVQLQKLLSKVQELERVQLQEARPTTSHQLVTAASVRTQNVKSLNDAQIVYAQPAALADPELNLKLELPVYRQPVAAYTTPMPARHDLTSSEELREFAMSQPANPQQSRDPAQDQDFKHYQQFFSSLEDNGERQSYQHMQPIYKTVTPTPSAPASISQKQPVVSAAPPAPPATPRPTPKQSDLAELQKLLYNTQQLQKLGVALPNELSQQLESQFQSQPGTTSTTSSTTSTTSSTSSTTSTTTTPAPLASPSPTHDSSSPAVFSLTTSKPASPRPPRPSPTTESSVELPVFSATKIIEAAIKRAANRIGVSTEQPLSLGAGSGFRRRSDDDMELGAQDEQDGVLDGDLMAEFSELNYQLAKPEPQAEAREQPELGADLGELQRLISNLQELQLLNVSLAQMKPASQSQMDAIYLQSLPPGIDTTKPRRQSLDNSSSTITSTSTSTTTLQPEEPITTQAPTRISLDLGLSDGETDAVAGSDADIFTSTTTEASSSSSTTEESRNGSLDDLADSFGPDPVSLEPPPAKKKNGFYFLADWNSFLEVGDGDDQVVVRLSPKIGDPRDFLAV
ncbi:mucin-2 [Drosophila montana]|uniref:mucin-2 n=1 Tax=Drosophila montana TaxID=40370 RepID=UPI00313D32EA